MKTPVPTESRIFANQYWREARRLEIIHANAISPGTTTWAAAMTNLCERMHQSTPKRRVAMVRAAMDYMDKVPVNERGYFLMNGGESGSRSAAMVFQTLAAERHPMIDEEGVAVHQHVVSTGRPGVVALAGPVVAFISKHAIGRLHERGFDLTIEEATGIFSYVGLLGWIMRYDERHHGLSLNFGDTVAIGTVRRRPENYNLFDVRTVLPADVILDHQGLDAYKAVTEWLDDGLSPARTDKIAETIPVRPFRDDYVAAMAAE